jgi:hypothetical protein
VLETQAGAAKKAAEKQARVARAQAEAAARKAAEQSRKAAKEAVERSKPMFEAAKPAVAKGAEWVLEAAQTGSNGKTKKANDPTSLRDLRKALDGAIASGKPVPYDKALVTRLI